MKKINLMSLISLLKINPYLFTGIRFNSKFINHRLCFGDCPSLKRDVDLFNNHKLYQGLMMKDEFRIITYDENVRLRAIYRDEKTKCFARVILSIYRKSYKDFKNRDFINFIDKVIISNNKPC